MKVGNIVELRYDKFGVKGGARGRVNHVLDYHPMFDGPVVLVLFQAFDEPVEMRPHYLRLVSAIELLGELP